jgi:hypothetical protein
MNKYFCLLVAASSLIAVSCDSGTQTSSSPIPQTMTLAGLNLELSGQPQKAEFGLGEATPNTI